MSGHPDFAGAHPPLRLDIWIHPGGPDWNAIHVPADLTIFDGRAASHGHRDDRLTVRVRFSHDPTERLKGAQIELQTEPGSGANPPQPALATAHRSELGPDGSAIIADVQPGRYRLIAVAPGRVGRVIGWITPDSDSYQEFPVALSPEAALEGIVLGPDQAPVAGVRVTPMVLIGTDGRGYPMISEIAALTGPDGRFRLFPLPEGKMQFRADKPGLHQVWDPQKTIRLPADPQTVHMVSTGVLRVRVATSEGRASGDTVHVQEAARSGIGSWGGSSNPDPSGWAEFRDMPTGEYRVSREPILPGTAGGRIVVIEAGRTNEVQLTP